MNFQCLYTLLKEILLEKKLAGQPVFFILDGFESFVSNVKQILLYNLLDWMHTNSVQVAVVGLTRTLTVMQKLEKRVKSRYVWRCVKFKSTQRNA